MPDLALRRPVRPHQPIIVDGHPSFKECINRNPAILATESTTFLYSLNGGDGTRVLNRSNRTAPVVQSPVLYRDWRDIASTLQLVQQSLLKPLPHAFRDIQLMPVLLHAVWLSRVHDEAGVYALIF